MYFFWPHSLRLLVRLIVAWLLGFKNVTEDTRAKRLHMRKVSIFKMAVANANFTTRTPFFELKSNFISIQNFKAARISRKFAAIVQESRSFRQIRASLFSVFMFDFRMKQKWGNKRWRLRWQVPPNLVLCPASAGKNPENLVGFGGLLLWLRDLWYPQELNFQERTLSLLSRLQHWRMDSQFRVLLSHKHYFHERWTIASK